MKPDPAVKQMSRQLGGDSRTIETAEFAFIVDLVRKTAGISLTPNKRELVAGRLNRRLRALGYADFRQYVKLLAGVGGAAELPEMINAITTNLTSFFREPHHFRYLAQEILAPLAKQGGGRHFRIWSAACSSGEEPYSAAMVLHRFLPSSRPRTGQWDARILATDIDSSMVATAKDGKYDADRVVSIANEYRGYITEAEDEGVCIADVIKKYIIFKQLNLLDPWPMRGLFDVVFCRNVVIYFEKDVQRVLFDRIADILKPHGVLFIGHSETLFRVCERFESLGHTIYRKIK